MQIHIVENVKGLYHGAYIVSSPFPPSTYSLTHIHMYKEETVENATGTSPHSLSSVQQLQKQ